MVVAGRKPVAQNPAYRPSARFLTWYSVPPAPDSGAGAPNLRPPSGMKAPGRAFFFLRAVGAGLDSGAPRPTRCSGCGVAHPQLLPNPVTFLRIFDNCGR